MATISEDYVSFETAKLLKENRFDYPSYCHYRLNNGELCNFNTSCNTNLEQNDYITAPTIQMAMKWLREVHYRHINIIHQWLPMGYRFSIEKLNKGYFYTISRNDVYKTYEEACEAAIKFCLKKMI